MTLDAHGNARRRLLLLGAGLATGALGSGLLAGAAEAAVSASHRHLHAHHNAHGHDAHGHDPHRNAYGHEHERGHRYGHQHGHGHGHPHGHEGPHAARSRHLKGERALAFDNLHTGERLHAVYWSDGRYLASGRKEINWVLRDFRTDQVHPIDPAVLDLLHALQNRLECRGPFEVISGYRSPATNAMLAATTEGVARHSLHMQGQAIDIRLAHVPLVTLHRAAVSLRAGGVGLYRASDFVHVDVGRVRYW